MRQSDSELRDQRTSGASQRPSVLYPANPPVRPPPRPSLAMAAPSAPPSLPEEPRLVQMIRPSVHVRAVEEATRQRDGAKAAAEALVVAEALMAASLPRVERQSSASDLLPPPTEESESDSSEESTVSIFLSFFHVMTEYLIKF